MVGAGDKAFVSGADISKFENERASDTAASGLSAFGFAIASPGLDS